MVVFASSPTDRFVLTQVNSIEWTVEDASVGWSHPRRVVARIYEADEFEYDVLWEWDLPLPTKYMRPADVIDDIRRATARKSRIPSQKPIPIPHRSPVPLMVG